MTVLFYETESCSVPVEAFIRSLPARHGAKVYWEIELLKEHGTMLKEPYVKQIRGDRYRGLWELRIRSGGDASRIIYFALSGDAVVLLHGFVKKTMKTPKRELETALSRKEDHQRRYSL